MPAGNSHFRVVMRGYDATEVDRRVGELTDAATAAQQQAQELSSRLREVEEHSRTVQEASQGHPASPPSFDELGERIGQILVLAEEEAAAIRAAAKSDFDSQQRLADEAAGRTRVEADQYAEQQRGAADAEAARSLQDARRQADEMLDGAERDASARIQEAEAVYEGQRARAAQAAADFETTLAKRRDSSEQEFTQQFETSQEQLANVQARVEQMRSEADKLRSDAELQARRLIEDAEQRAEETVARGAAYADRIRTESERELTATTQRRDSINAQLTNVRQMLATLSGVAPGAFLGYGLDEHPDEHPDEPPEASSADVEGSRSQTDADDADDADDAADMPVDAETGYAHSETSSRQEG